MPAARLRGGNALVKAVNYELAAGVQPSVCELHLAGACVAKIGQAMHVSVMGSDWRGNVQSAVVHKRAGVGTETIVRGVDCREYLQGALVFGQANMIDENTGEVYSIYANWEEQVEDDQAHYSAKEIIEDWLLGQVAGFSFTAEYSEAAEERLSSAGDDWRTSGGNLFNLDWNTGALVSHALEQVCDALSIYPVMKSVTGDSATLRFVVVGEQDASFLDWEAVYAKDHSVGTAIAPEVETGVYIMGERDVFETQEWEWEPGWNQEWNQYFWDPAKLLDLGEKLEALGLHMESLTLGDLADADWEPGGLDASGFAKLRENDDAYAFGKHFNDMTIAEYLSAVPFKMYKFPRRADWLTVQEMNGGRTIRTPMIITPLPSDPGVSCVVRGSVLVWADEWKRRLLKQVWYAEDEPLPEDDYSLDAATGFIRFRAAKCRFTDAGKAAITDRGELKYSHIMPDRVRVTCAVQGKVFLNFYGDQPKVGIRKVEGLRRAFTVSEELTRSGMQDDALGEQLFVKPYVRDGEKDPALIASEYAANILARKRVVTSGEATFAGIAGHQPSGEIRRVRVSVSEGTGLQEVVSYANDVPSHYRPLMVDLQRRILDKMAAREADRLRTDRRRNRMLEMYAAARAGNSGAGAAPYSNATIGKLPASAAAASGDNNGILSVKITDECTYEKGCGVIYTNDTSDGAPETLAFVDTGRSPMGVVLSAGESYMTVQTSGVCAVRVKGTVAVGDKLVMDPYDHYLYTGKSSSCVALETGANEVISARIQPHNEGMAVTAKAATTENVTLYGEQTIDGVSLVAGDSVLVKDQNDTTENGVYIVAAEVWQRACEVKPGMMVTVQNGSDDSENKGVWMEDEGSFTVTQ